MNSSDTAALGPPVLAVRRGSPTDEEIAAIVLVLLGNDVRAGEPLRKLPRMRAWVGDRTFRSPRSWQHRQ